MSEHWLIASLAFLAGALATFVVPRAWKWLHHRLLSLSGRSAKWGWLWVVFGNDSFRWRYRYWRTRRTKCVACGDPVNYGTQTGVKWGQEGGRTVAWCPKCPPPNSDYLNYIRDEIDQFTRELIDQVKEEYYSDPPVLYTPDLFD